MKTKVGSWILNDESIYYPIFGEQCVRCKHWSPERPVDFVGSKCAAFARIPREILEGRHDHTHPFPGDGGIRFEPIG